MPRHSYRGRDYAFGQVTLKLRSSIGLTQAGLADLLEVSRRAVGEWEAGLNYPKAEHFKHFLELCVQQHVFAVNFDIPWAECQNLHNATAGPQSWLFPTLSVPACCLWMEISFSIVFQRKTLMKNEVKEDGRVAVSAPV